MAVVPRGQLQIKSYGERTSARRGRTGGRACEGARRSAGDAVSFNWLVQSTIAAGAAVAKIANQQREIGKKGAMLGVARYSRQVGGFGGRVARARLALAAELALLPFMDGIARLGQAPLLSQPSSSPLTCLSFFASPKRQSTLLPAQLRSLRRCATRGPFLHRLLFLAATHRRRASKQSPFPPSQPIHPRADLAAATLSPRSEASLVVRLAYASHPPLHSRPSTPSLPHPTAVHSLLPLGSSL
jgi:hypothetical protein